jgi:hypothetical protein
MEIAVKKAFFIEMFKKNTRLLATSTSLIEPSIRRTMFAGAIELAVIAYSCLGQAIDNEADSLLIDFHTAANKGVSQPVDTVPQHDSIKSMSIDTMSHQQEIKKPVISDTLPQQLEMSKPVSTDTVPQQQEMSKPVIIEPARPRKEEEAPVQPAIHNLAPFSSDRMHCLGVSLDYFSYAEASTINDIPDGYPPNFVLGSPKSTEYGFAFGVDYEGSIRKHGSQLLFRPKLEGKIGIHQTYDGSTQALAITNSSGDTIGFQFLPAKFSKSNYFAQAELDIGYCRTHAIEPFYLYSGIKGNLWYRDLVPDTISYHNQITNSEVYYWFSAPLGLAVSLPLSPTLSAGIDACCDVMFFGQMQVLNSAWDAVNTYETISPAVTLGNKTGFRTELSIMYKSGNGNIFRFAPYFNLYAFGQSESEISKSYVNGAYTEGSDQGFKEPSSQSWLLGAKLQIVFLSPYTRTY